MINPIEVEKRYLDLCEKFPSVPSLRQRWLLIYNFLSLVQENPVKFDSYLRQLISYFPAINDPITLTGIDPEWLRSVLRLLNEVYGQIPELNNRGRLEKARKELLGGVCLLYGFIGELEEIIHTLEIGDPSQKTGLLEWAERIEEDEEVSNFGKFEILSERLSQSNLAQTEVIKKVRQQWANLRKTAKPSVLIPVVEKSAQKETDFHWLGRLRSIKMKVMGISESGRDVLNSNLLVLGAEEAEQNTAEMLMAVVRKHLNEHYPGLQSKFFELQQSYRLGHGWHTGRSSELATALLVYISILKSTDQRKRHELQSDIIITGRMHEDGTVLSVEESSINRKTEAAFFSWANKLVVPKQQESQFRQAYSDLIEEYPHKDLNIIGVKHFKDLFYDRRITSYHIESRIAFGAKKVWKHKFSAAGVSIILLLGLIIARLIYGPLDRNPVAASFEGDMMLVENKYGNVIHEINIGSGSVDYLNRENVGNRSIPYAFVDVDQDGTNEILWSRLRSEGKEEVTYLNCTSAGSDSLIWSLPLKFETDFPRKQDITTHVYNLHRIHYIPEQAGADGMLVLVLKHKRYFPGILISLELQTGEIIGSYLHTGHIRDIVGTDLDGDGNEEIVAVAQNNAFNQITTLTVLDPRKLDGHSPTRGDYMINEMSRASEILYMAIPRTIVGKAFKKRVVNNMPADVSIKSDEKLIEVSVWDFRLANPTKYEAGHGKLFFYFDYNMQLQSVGTGSYYDLWARNLYEEERIPYIPDFDYFEAFKDSLLYWDGEGFVRKAGLFQDL
jgi:hypothetical protein